jgi:TM2 domain-containing membrane protein YozV
MTDAMKSNQKQVPALLSFFVPGLGQIIKGQVGKGILVFLVLVLG